MAYGTTAGVAALVPRYAGTGADFTATTRPTVTYVTTYLGQVSSLLDVMLAETGFVTPVTAETVKPMLAMFVEQEVADIVEGINGLGRFGPGGGDNQRERRKSRFLLLKEDIEAFIGANAVGMERMGAARIHAVTSGIGYRATNERGNAIFPFFERDNFIEDAGFKDADRVE